MRAGVVFVCLGGGIAVESCQEKTNHRRDFISVIKRSCILHPIEY